MVPQAQGERGPGPVSFRATVFARRGRGRRGALFREAAHARGAGALTRNPVEVAFWGRPPIVAYM